jgi:hypothetical protein
MKADPPQSKISIFDDLPPFVGIVGSRKFKNKEWVVEFVKRLKPETTVVSGGAIGVDSWAAETAREQGLRTKEFLIDGWEWEVLGKRAGHIRNATMAAYLKEVGATLIVFSQVDKNDTMTRGTHNMVIKASQLQIPMVIYTERTQ